MAKRPGGDLVPVIGQGVRAVGALLPRFRGAGIRGKVTWALVGIIALVLPQVLLTVSFMVELAHDSERIQTLTNHAALVSRLAAVVDELARTPSWEAEALTENSKTLERRVQDLAVLADATPELTPLALDAAVRVERFRAGRLAPPPEAPERSAVGIWLGRVDDAHDALAEDVARWRFMNPEPSPEALAERLVRFEERAVGALDEVVARALPQVVIEQANSAARARRAQRAQTQAAAEARASLSQLRLTLDTEIASAADRARGAVDRANRYIVTLVLLTIVYVIGLVLLLPNRLVRPLNHLVAVMNRVADGHFEVETRMQSDDEVGRVARALDLLIRRVESFDALKRDRIFEDRRRLGRLMELVSYPVAILDTHHRVEYANAPFRTLFDLPARCEDLSLLSFVDGGGVEDFVLVLEETLRRQHQVNRLATTLRTPAGVRRYLMSLEVTRDRRGQVASLIMRLEPAAAEAREATEAAGAPS